MAIPRQNTPWDERRNTSAVRLPAPNALRDCLRSLAELRRRDPALVKWIEEGAPLLTGADHERRFGVPFRRRK